MSTQVQHLKFIFKNHCVKLNSFYLPSWNCRAASDGCLILSKQFSIDLVMFSYRPLCTACESDCNIFISPQNSPIVTLINKTTEQTLYDVIWLCNAAINSNKEIMGELYRLPTTNRVMFKKSWAINGRRSRQQVPFIHSFKRMKHHCVHNVKVYGSMVDIYASL